MAEPTSSDTTCASAKMSSLFYECGSSSSIDTVSLGMLVIDEIQLPSRPPLIDVVGGSGTYASLGSRIFASSTQSQSVGCLVLAGDDFPENVREQLLRWQITLQINGLKNKLSTRELLIYKDDIFGPPLKASPSDLVGTGLLVSRSFHMLATPEEIEAQLPSLVALRMEAGIKEQSFVVWEPLPAACTTKNKEAFLRACRLVDVFSPNHLEMAALFSDDPPKTFEPHQLQLYARRFSKEVGTSGKGIVIVRAGEHGSLTVQNLWLPPFYHLGATNVVDPTGAGNTFLGGFIQGWRRTQDIKEASAYANIAASFAIEQIGLPQREMKNGEELWNGVNVHDRLKDYRTRLTDACSV